MLEPMNTTQVIEVPRPRTEWVPPAPLPYERGSCGGHRLHAVRNSLTGCRALCDSRLEPIRIGGRFDLDDLDSCIDCIIETTAFAP